VINPQCLLCQRGVGNEEGLTATAVAERYGVSRRSVGRHRRHLAEADLRAASASPLPGDVEFGDIPGYTVTSRGASILQEDGSWVKVAWKPNAVDPQEFLQYDDLVDIISSPLPVPQTWTPRAHTEFLMVSDLQIGKAMQRGGGTEETLARARQSLATFVARVQRSQPHTIVIADGGDPIENIFNVKGQIATNDLTPDAQVRTFRRLMAEFIRALAPYAPNVIFLSVPSNHGAVRNGYGSDSQVGTVDADWGLDINYSLEEQFVGRRGFEHVRFMRPQPGFKTAVLDVSGTRVAVNHGDDSKGVLKHGEWWQKQDHGRLPGWDAQILVMSHYHTFNVGHSGNGRWIISASSSDPGSDWFTNVTGEAARQGMTAFSVEDGQWFDLAIV